MMEKKNVVIIGGGLTGLVTAYRLAKAKIDFILLEKSDRLGGVIHTERVDGFTYETGPNTGILGTPELVEVIEDLGPEIELQVGNSAVKRRLILKGGKWKALPSDPVSAVTTPLFTLRDKFRILGEPFRKKGDDPDETLDKLVLRRMGKSFLDYAIDPFIIGVYAGDPSLLVTRAAFPKLYALEQNYGSFIGGTMKKRKEEKSPLEKMATREVFSFQGGLEKFIVALANGSGNANIKTGIDETVVKKTEDGYVVNAFSKGQGLNIATDMVISCINGSDLDNKILPFVPSQHVEAIRAVRYAATVEVVLGFKNWTGRRLDAFGGLIPHREGRELLGILFLSSFLPGRAPEGGALLTIFMGGVRNPKWIDASDEEIKEVVKKEVSDLMEIDNYYPDLIKIYRHRGAIPQYSFESDAKMKAVEQIHRAFPGLIIGGNALDGIGIADRVKQGYRLAARAKEFLGAKR